MHLNVKEIRKAGSLAMSDQVNPSYEVQIHAIAEWATSDKLMISMADNDTNETLCAIFACDDVHPCDAAKLLVKTAQNIVAQFLADS